VGGNRQKGQNMTLPKIELTQGYDYAYHIVRSDYTDISKMLEDIVEGLKEYPNAILLANDDVKNMKMGYVLRVIDGQLERWWEFMIKVVDFKKTQLLCIIKHSEWNRAYFTTQSGRSQLANDLIEHAKNINEDSADNDRGGFEYL
jgi:hypothetical protein